MGGFSAQVQQGQTSGGGKFDQMDGTKPQSMGAPELQGVNGVITNSATSDQPSMGAPNQYPNTVGQWDNAVQQPNQSMPQLGKGKGA